MIHLRTASVAEDTALLRSLALFQMAHGGFAQSQALLELARAISPDDHLVLIQLARVRAHTGDLVSAAKLMSEAIRLAKNLQAADLAFAQSLVKA